MHKQLRAIILLLILLQARILSLTPFLSRKAFLSMSSPKTILLGSGSSSRKQLLSEMGYSFNVVKADIDERAIGDRTSDARVEELVLLLANAKADTIISRLPMESKGPILLTADQVVTCNGKILEKPLNIEEFRGFVSEYSIFPCRTVGSVVLTDTATGRRVQGVDTATIYLRPLPQETVEALISEGGIFYCAGGLMIENPLVEPHIDRVEGTLDSVMGLSKELVQRLMQELRS